MNGREYFHESVVRDIVDILTDMKDFDEVQFITNSKSNRSFKSITSATKDLILTFPVMVSTDIDPDNAIMLAKAHEKKCASLLHILFTAISVSNNEDVYDYVRKFHANVGNMTGTLDSYADSLDRLYNKFDESYDASKPLKIDHDVLNAVLEDLRNSNYILPDNLKESSLESYKIIPGYRTEMDDMIIQEASQDGTDFTITNFTDDDARNRNSVNLARDTLISGQLNYDATPEELDRLITRNADGTYSYLPPGGGNSITIDDDEYRNLYRASYRNVGAPANKGAVNTTIQIKGSPTYSQQNYLQNAEYMKNINDAHSKMVLNTEYKKANELQPTMMVVNFMRHSKDGDFINSAVIGIKAKIYPVSSSDICSRISRKLDDKKFLTNFVRATTNEIAFFRDFLFAVDNAKLDAKAYGKQASSNKLWKVLERRSVKSKFRRSLKMYNDATAISTLVISENDVEYLKKVNSIDILNIVQARKLLDAYNFMCICVLNQSTEVASLLYDTGDDTYEMVPFTGLEREASDNSYKKMVNLMSKMSR